MDFGCGAKPYKELFEVENYIGVDIKQLKSKYTDERVDILYDGKTLPFKNESFDSIFTSEVIEHIFEADNILSEWHRVLKKSSYILVTVPFVMEEHEIPYDFARYSSYGIKYLLEKHGFEIVHAEKTTNYIETIFQMWNMYLVSHVFPKNTILRNLLTIVIIAPFNLLGIIFGAICPKQYDLYLNNVIVARKY